jgi:hypothetical protein
MFCSKPLELNLCEGGVVILWDADPLGVFVA